MADIHRRNRGDHFGMYARPVVRFEVPAATVVVGRHTFCENFLMGSGELLSLGYFSGELGVRALVESAELQVSEQNPSVLTDDKNSAV